MQQVRTDIVLLVGFARADVVGVGSAEEFDELLGSPRRQTAQEVSEAIGALGAWMN